MPIPMILKSRTGRLVWLVLFCITSLQTTKAQKYFFDNYGVKQGLSEQKVYTILQDSKDFIWLGTANGVSRFDGKKFENFSSRNGLAPAGVRSMKEDLNGNIWFGHLNGGISRFNGNFFEQAAFDSLAISGDVTSIQILGDSLIWFTTNNDGAILAVSPFDDIKHLKAEQYRGKNGLSDQIYGSALNRNNEFICIADVGMRKYNSQEKKFENYRMPHMTTYFNPTCMLDDSKGIIWFGTVNGGVYKYDLARSKMDVIDLIKSGMGSNWVSCITEDSKGRIWVGTWGGGIGVITDGNIFVYNESNGLEASNIYEIIEDVEGNILIADQVNGLTIFKGDAFTTISEENILPDPNVYAIYQDKTGTMWFGTNAGISRYIPWSGKNPVIYDQKSSYIFNEIRFFREDKNGNLWIGSNEGGVVMFNMKTDRFESQPYIYSKLYPGGQVKAMEIDRENNLWIGTLEGVAVGTIGKDNFERWTVLDSLTVSNITALYCDPEGNMWVGTEPRPGKPGLIKYISSGKDFVPVTALPGIIPKALLMDRNGILWIGTGEGLIAFRNDSVLFRVTQDDGLLSDNINLLAEGSDGSIFIGTNNGLNRYFPVSKRIYSYTERNGFTGIETKPSAVFKSANGDLWFGTAGGATRLDFSELTSKGLEPLTHILSMQVNYDIRKMESGLRLSYKERTLLFDYCSICLTNPDVVRYKVMLEGADEDWRPVTDQTRSIHSALPPGKYTFKVIASNDEGIWNKEPALFHFTIRPPFYLTLWFILTALVSLVLLVIAYINIRERNLVKEKIILEKKVKERTAEVVQKSLIIEEKNRDITASIRYAERIQRAMLPRQDAVENMFVLYMPKDIVSGDFYWMHDNGDSLFIAAVDCTGHGVPGAFMSIIGHNSLNKVVREYGITRPSAILDQLNTEINKAILQSHEKGINDGMDLTLIAYRRKSCTMELAGAYNPLYRVRNGEVTVFKTDRFPIGMVTHEQKKSFTNINVDIRPGDMLYMSSDGYADQFGSPNIKKFKTGNLKKVLAAIADLPVAQQKARLEKEILDWKGELPQVDDIMLIGLKIPGCQ
jgi:ligand-binding sensor domain-containing protein/serine phosphatase RsbU (regulator of sigma subunit)